MLAPQRHKAFEATVKVQKASVESMSTCFHPYALRNSDSCLRLPGTLIALKFFLAASAVFLALFLLLVPNAGALAVQSNVDTGLQPEEANMPPAFSVSLQPALQQVGTSVSRIQIDRWKLPQNWKSQLHSDADSIQQDLSHQLPALFQQVQASPAALDAQMRVMQNVNALYDVLVRLTMAANLTEKKNDAAMLDNALQRLESARKTASDQLLHAVLLQNQQIVHLQTQLAEGQAGEHPSASHAKTIIVDNEATHRIQHRRVRHKQASPPSPTSKPGQNGVQSSPGKAPTQG